MSIVSTNSCPSSKGRIGMGDVRSDPGRSSADVRRGLTGLSLQILFLACIIWEQQRYTGETTLQEESPEWGQLHLRGILAYRTSYVTTFGNNCSHTTGSSFSGMLWWSRCSTTLPLIVLAALTYWGQSIFQSVLVYRASSGIAFSSGCHPPGRMLKRKILHGTLSHML